MDVFLQNRISVRNLDAYSGLGVSFHFIDVSHVEATINGRAGSHRSPEDEDINKLLKFDFSSSLMENETITIDLSSGVFVDFINKAVLTTTPDTFLEDNLNIGKIRQDNNTIIEITNGEFAKTIKTITDNVSFINLPEGLNVEFSFAGNDQKKLSVQLGGQAVLHTDANDVNNLQFEFKSGAFKDNIAIRSGNMRIDFIDNPYFTATNRFLESVANDGTIANRVTVQIEDGTTLDTTRSVVKGDMSISLPIGLEATYRIISPKEIEIELIGQVTNNKHKVEDSTILSLEFNNINPFIVLAGAVLPASVPIALEFVDAPIIEIVVDSVNSGKFKESFENDGSIDNNITLRVSGDTIDTNFIGKIQGLITPTNLSPDYKASFAIRNASTIVVSLSGEAVVHKKSDSSNDLKFTFDGALFSAGVGVTEMKKGVSINFIDGARFLVNGNNPTDNIHFLEDGINNGSVDSFHKVTLTLINDTFTGEDINGEFFSDYDVNSNIVTSNLPNGMRLSAETISDKIVILTLSGKNDAHNPTDSISNISVRFLEKKMFKSGIIPDSAKNIKLDYIDYQGSSIDGRFIESQFNDGSIDSKVTISLQGALFSHINNIRDAIRTNIPRGLTPSYEISFDNKDLIISLDGNAIAHRESNNTDIKFSFIDKNLFANEVVIKEQQTKINFSDRSTMSVIGILKEDSKNDGSLGNSTLKVILVGDKFKANPNVNNVTIQNLPIGLIVDQLNISGDRQTAEITFAGKTNPNDITQNRNDLELSLTDNVFESGTAPSPVSGIVLEFLDSPDLKFSSNLLEKSSDVGEIGGELVLTLSGDTFDIGANLKNSINIDYDVDSDPNVTKYEPIKNRLGLTPVYTLDTPNLLKISFTGNALDHRETNEGKIRVTFDENVFTKKIVPAPIETNIDFIKKPKLSYNKVIKESPENKGTFNDEFVISVQEGSLSDMTPIELSNAISMQLVDGLQPTYRVDTGEQKIFIKINGNALSHAPLDSVSNLNLHIGKGVFKNNIELDLDNIGIKFVDNPIVRYDKVFYESILDDGSIANVVTLAFEGDKLAPLARLNDDIEVKNLPYGLTPIFKKQSENIILMELIPTLGANPDLIKHSTAESATLEVIFQPNIFYNGTPPVNIKDLQVIFKDTPVFESTNFVFKEKEVNDGTIENKITFELKGDRFVKGVNPNAFLEATNVPVGFNLQSEIDNTDDTKIILSLVGQAREHGDIDDVKVNDKTDKEIKVRFSNSLFVNGVSPKPINVGIDFLDILSFSANDIFYENNSDDGSIFKPIILTLKDGGSLKNVNPNNLISVQNVPAGLVPRFLRLNNRTMQVTLEGNALIHEIDDSVDDMIITFERGLFLDEKRVSPFKTKIIYKGAPSVSIQGIFTEENAKSNDGTINNAVTLFIENDTFKSDVDPNKYITLKDVPDGLKPVFTYINPKTIVFTLEGKAKDHLAIDNTDIKLSIDQILFNNEIALFRDPKVPDFDLEVPVEFDSVLAPVLSNDGDFFEDVENDGSIVNSIFINSENGDFVDNYKFRSAILIDDLKSFIGVKGNFNNKSFLQLGENIIEDIDLTLNEFDLFDNIKNKINNLGRGTDGLYAQVVVDKDFRRKLAIVKNDINRKIEISGPTNLKQTLKNFWNIDDIQFPASGRADNGIFVSRLVPLKNSLSEVIEVTNLIKGLESRFVLKDNNTIEMFIDGKAEVHSQDQSIIDLSLSFDSGMFKKKMKPVDIETIAINFNDPEIKHFGEFKESEENDGTIESYITLVLRGDKFVDNINYKDYISVSNVPVGLEPVFTQESDTILRVSLEGTALHHEDQDDVGNMEFKFQPDIFQRGIIPKPVEGVLVDFDNAPDPASIAGGPGIFGGYLTFISPTGKNIIITTSSKEFGLDHQEFQTTTTLANVTRDAYNEEDMRGLGYEKDPALTEKDGGYGFGMSSKFGASLVIDSVDASIDKLSHIRQNISSNYNRIEKRIDFLSTEKLNIDSANSTLRDVNFAEETTEFNKRNILARSGNFVLTQAGNMQKDQILDLIKNNTI
jgi:flagellin-like hook-associated protein FlgL